MQEQLFSRNLRFLRKQGGHNQDEISVLFNKRPNTIGNWENRKSEPSLSELVRLGEFFQVSVSELLHRDLEKEGRIPASSGPDSSVKSSFSGSEKTSLPGSGTASMDMAMIMNELKSIQARIDALGDRLKSAVLHSRQDKSSH